ncbi:MAG: RNA 2',3'-cyclic phosphodiesterase [Pseudomonadota bacterium]
MRSFIAIPLPEDIADAAEDLQEGLRGANWTDAETMHLTLAFLGEQDRRSLEDLDSHLLGLDAPSFSLALEGVGIFGDPREARLVYAGVADAPLLRRLQSKVMGAAREAGLSLETRRFTPHVTLARWSRGAVPAEPLLAYLSAHNLFRSAVFDVTSFTLYRSDLGRSGAAHTPLAEYALRPA